MKTAICYFSSHHNNTLKLLEALAEGNDIELIDVRSRSAVRLELYDAVGFASGIYFGKFHDSVISFLRQYLPEGADVFFVSTCGHISKRNTAAVSAAAAEKGSRVLGSFACRGYDTFGPFKLVGGIAKGRPDARDLQNAREFYASLKPSSKNV